LGWGVRVLFAQRQASVFCDFKAISFISPDILLNV
jgi:hypothetical protein